jgi:hypothetical protein
VPLGQLIDTNDKSAPAVAFRKRFAQAIPARLETLDGYAVWASNDKQHGVVNANAEWSVSTVNGLLLPASIGGWYQAPCTPFVHVANQ